MSNSGKPSKSSKNTAPKKTSPARRLRSLKRWSISLVVLAALGAALFFYSQLAAQERDLSVIGNGTPTIVQVMDTGCRLCQQLQRNSKSALRPFNDDVQWRVANIDTVEGLAFARRQGVEHVTLVLFDSRGRRVRVISGVSSSETLSPIFEDLASR
ncbi:hypothetical protein [Saccharospirillum impatiens]|uniref:hypothetical protein n=1 Tax=Saccharospirillum impatiens TaxID=169438 RepID=UPI00041031FD|nr:hypothetical protein [Saccharospirillum impatiens]